MFRVASNVRRKSSVSACSEDSNSELHFFAKTLLYSFEHGMASATIALVFESCALSVVSRLLAVGRSEG